VRSAYPTFAPRMTNTLIYQAYGLPGIRLEAAYSILSAYAAGGGG